MSHFLWFTVYIILCSQVVPYITHSLAQLYAGGEPFLLLANRVDIRKVVPSVGSRHASEYTSVVRGLENAISLDVHMRRGLIYWTDATLNSIKRTFINISSSSSSSTAALSTDVMDVINTGLDSPGPSSFTFHDLKCLCTFRATPQPPKLLVVNFTKCKIMKIKEIHKNRRK